MATPWKPVTIPPPSRSARMPVPTERGVDACRIVELPKIGNPRGNLTFIEGGVHVPFPVKRVYYLYDVPGGEMRGGHAHRDLQQLLIAISGSFNVVIDDGFDRMSFSLNRSYYGLYLPTMVWRELVDFSSGSVCLVLASTAYEESDYIRDYSTFQREAREKDPRR